MVSKVQKILYLELNKEIEQMKICLLYTSFYPIQGMSTKSSAKIPESNLYNRADEASLASTAMDSFTYDLSLIHIQMCIRDRVYINGANNLKATRRLRSLTDIAGYGDNDQFKGYNDLDKQAYIDFYNKYGEQGIEDIISRIEQGN